MDAIIEELRQKPNLKSLLDELNLILQEEDRKRADFYNTITENDKAEFINGEVIMHSPVKLQHADASGRLFSLMHSFAMKYDLGSIFTEKVMIHLSRNSYEPDIIFFKKEKTEKFTRDQMLFPAPDLIVEVLSPSTEKNDRGIKFIDYALHGVQEYWLLDPVQQLVEQYLLKNNHYELEFKGKSGSVSSISIANLVIEVKSVYNEDECGIALQKTWQSQRLKVQIKPFQFLKMPV